MYTLFFALGRFLGAFCASWCAFGRSWLFLVRLGTLRVRFSRGVGNADHGFGGPKRRFWLVFAPTRGSTAQILRPLQNCGRGSKNHGFLLMPAQLMFCSRSGGYAFAFPTPVPSSFSVRRFVRSTWNPPHCWQCPGVLDQYAFKLLALNTCINML